MQLQNGCRGCSCSRLILGLPTFGIPAGNGERGGMALSDCCARSQHVRASGDGAIHFRWQEVTIHRAPDAVKVHCKACEVRRGGQFTSEQSLSVKGCREMPQKLGVSRHEALQGVAAQLLSRQPGGQSQMPPAKLLLLPQAAPWLRLPPQPQPQHG